MGALPRPGAVLGHHPHPRHDVRRQGSVSPRPGGRELRRARHGQARDAPRDRRQPQPLRPDDRRSAAARTAGREAARGQRHSGRRARRGDGDDRRHPRAVHRRARRCSSRATRSSSPTPSGRRAWATSRRRAPCRCPAACTRRWAGGTISRSSSRRSRRRHARSTSTRRTTRPAASSTRQDVEAIAAICRDRNLWLHLGRGVRGCALRRRRAREPGFAAGHVRAHDLGVHVQQVVRDDGPSPRIRRRAGRRSCASG